MQPGKRIERTIALAGLAALALAAVNAPPLKFFDATASSGVRFEAAASPTSQKYLIETMGAGVAVFDYDGDGYPDLYFVNGAELKDPMPAGSVPDKSDPRYWNRLYHNNRDATFTDVTERAGVRGSGYGMGVAVGDFDNDGHPDLYVTNFGATILYRNRGDGTFEDVTDKAGVRVNGWSTGAAFFDYDRDGYLDLVVARYLVWDFSLNILCGPLKEGYRSYCHPDHFQPVTPLLFHNNGDGTFRDESERAGFTRAPGKGLGVAIGDFDRDGWPDILVANDSMPQQLFRNLRDGRFSEEALERGLAYDDNGASFAGMGAEVADYNNDGWPDVFIDALANQRYALFRNRKATFDYVSAQSKIAEVTGRHSGWGARFSDFGNHGWKDLVIAQGHVMDNIELSQPGVRYLEPLLLLRNNHGTFEDVSAQAGDAFRMPLAARGLAVGDLNNDGLLDLVVNCNRGRALVLLNRSGRENSWLVLLLTGTRSNRDAIGAQIHLVAESGLEQWATVSRAGSYLSASDVPVHFGLGRDRQVRRIEIQWPSGTVQTLEQVRANQGLAVVEK